MNTNTLYIAFAGTRRIAHGPLRDVLPVLKQRFDSDPADMVLVFDTRTGRQVDFDLRGSLDQVLQRVLPERPRGPGRPRLGVTSREITLLPRHWEWLDAQPSGISGALRRLVDHAIKVEPGQDRAARMRAAVGGFLTSMAGDQPGCEEACRALYAGQVERFEELTRAWPADIREFAVKQAREAAAAEKPGTQQEAADAVVADLYEMVWNRGDYRAIERLVAPAYTIHSDPGDGWEGRTLKRAEYQTRVQFTRRAFPDVAFTVLETVATGERVAVRWTATGTQTGDLPGLPATGKKLTFSGQTIYALEGGQVAGHWQVIDRLGFVQQLG